MVRICIFVNVYFSNTFIMKKIFLFAVFLWLGCGALSAQTLNDMVNLARYAAENAQLPAPSPGEQRVVFLGNSITEGWVKQRPAFFAENAYVGRGISGQTSPQLLLRFRQDVIDLKPVAVVINIGTNDIAENTGDYNPEFTLGLIQSMAELAAANGIIPILSSVLPVGAYPWRPSIQDVPAKIAALNTGIQQYTLKKGYAYVDYHTPMQDGKGALQAGYGSDGVHPNVAGYAVMEAVVQPVIAAVLAK
jgi:Lysophospholipase L1 and related esterases